MQISRACGLRALSRLHSAMVAVAPFRPEPNQDSLFDTITPRSTLAFSALSRASGAERRRDVLGLHRGPASMPR
jgi:hypothetical protein